METNTQAAIDAGKQIGEQVGRVVYEGHGVKRVAYPQDWHVADFSVETDRPFTKTGNRTLLSPASFAEYVNRHKTADTVIYADPKNAVAHAVLDDHGAEPGHRRHVAVYRFPRSVEWEAWRGLHRKSQSQAAFIDFLEDRLPDIIEPTGADVLEICRDMQGRADVAWKSATNLQSGAVQLSYQEDVTAESSKAGKIDFPHKIKIKAEIFYKGGLVALDVRLRFRVNGGALSFIPVIDNLELAEQQAFGEVVDGIAKMVGDDVLILEGQAGV